MKLKDFYRCLVDSKLQLADIKDLITEHFKLSFDDMFSDSSLAISDDEANKVLKLIAEDYPIPYIIGYLDVLGTRIFANEDVLIPEIETEGFLYDYVFNNFDLNNKRVLDLCTGSGFIALALKKHYPNASILASDISIKALETAIKSASYNSLDVDFICSDYFEKIEGKFDFIISNPPYIPVDSQYLVAKHSPALALFAGKDGLDSYRVIFKKFSSHLEESGTACFELESPNADKILSLFKEENPDFLTEIIKDMNDRDRYLVVKRIKRYKA